MNFIVVDVFTCKRLLKALRRLLLVAVCCCRCHAFRLMAERLEQIAAFIGQGPPMMPFDRHVKQPITVHFVQCHVSGRGNVATISNRCVKLADVLQRLYAANFKYFTYFWKSSTLSEKHPAAACRSRRGCTWGGAARVAPPTMLLIG